MSIFVAGALAAMALFGSEPAATGDLIKTSDAVPVAGAAKQLAVCEGGDIMAIRAFRRTYGMPQFVTAQEVIDAREAGTSWARPRCITPSQLSKLQKMTDGLVFAEVNDH